MSIGSKIGKLRKEKELTQEEFAKKLFVSSKTISSWEVERTLPSVDYLYLISKIFDVSIDDLLNEDIQKQYSKTYKQTKIFRVIYIIILLIVPIIYFMYMNRFGYYAINAQLISGRLTSDFIKDIYNTLLEGILLDYIVYSLMQFINYFIYLKNDNKIMIIISLAEIVIFGIFAIPFTKYNMDTLLILVAPITNILLIFISKK